MTVYCDSDDCRFWKAGECDRGYISLACDNFKPKSRFVELPCEESELLQEAVNVMNGINEYHRCWICDAYKSESCDRDKYLRCDEFTWRGIKPTEKGE